MSDEPNRLEGGIYASCGHRLADDEGDDGFGFRTITLGDDCDADTGVYRCSFHGSACTKCFAAMSTAGYLATQEEANHWVVTGELPTRMKTQSADVEIVEPEAERGSAASFFDMLVTAASWGKRKARK